MPQKTEDGKLEPTAAEVKEAAVFLEQGRAILYANAFVVFDSEHQTYDARFVYVDANRKRQSTLIGTGTLYGTLRSVLAFRPIELHQVDPQ